MTVMRVTKVGVAMPELRMRVPVRVGLSRWLATVMAVLMMLVMHVLILVGHLLVTMLVLVALGEMQPDAEGHEGTRGGDLDRHRFP